MCILKELKSMESKRVRSEHSICEKQSFTWELPNFLEMLKSDEVISAQRFTFEMGQSIGLPAQWQCLLYPSEYITCEYDEEYIGVYVELLKSFTNQKQFHINASFQVNYTNTKNGRKFYFNENLNESISEGQYIGFDSVLPTDRHDINKLLVNGTMIIQLNMTIFNISDKPKTIEALLNTFQNKFAQKFQSDKSQVKKDATSSSRKTVTIISKDGTKFHANRNILVARSPIFQTMFETQTWTERESSLFKIDDVSAQALQIILDFCETGTLDLETDFWKNVAMVEELCYAAHKFMLDDLTDFLDNGLGLLCNVNTYGHLTFIAKKFGMQKAKQDLLNYFRENFDWDNISFGEDAVSPEDLARNGYPVRVILQEKQNISADVRKRMENEYIWKHIDYNFDSALCSNCYLFMITLLILALIAFQLCRLISMLK